MRSDPAAVDDSRRPMQPPGDWRLAVRAEYDAAVAKNTVEAYALFIARQPDSPLAVAARARMAALTGRR